MPRPLKWGILGASTIILSKDIDKYAFMCGSNFHETDVRVRNITRLLLKFRYSEKATKVCPIFHLEFDAAK